MELKFSMRHLSKILLVFVIMNALMASADQYSPAEKYFSKYFPSTNPRSVTAAARTIAVSDFIFSGTMKATSDAQSGQSREVKGRIVLNELLYGSSESSPAAVSFERLASPFIESKIFAPFYGWNADHPMDNTPVVVFLQRSKDKWNIVKVVPIVNDGDEILFADLKLLQNAEIWRWRDNPHTAAAVTFDSERNPIANAVVRIKKKINK